MKHNRRRVSRGGWKRQRGPGPNNFELETLSTRAAWLARWEELMLVKPHVARDTSSVNGKIVYRIWYPRLVK